MPALVMINIDAQPRQSPTQLIHIFVHSNINEILCLGCVSVTYTKGVATVHSHTPMYATAVSTLSG